jgi:ubiquinone/menaquinone biosynthesis C-methylase UbiE
VVFAALFNISESKKGKKILEVGCGTGLGIVTAFNYLDKNTCYTATDLSDRMIEYSIKNVLKISG